MLSSHNGIKLEVNDRRKFGVSTSVEINQHTPKEPIKSKEEITTKETRNISI